MRNLNALNFISVRTYLQIFKKIQEVKSFFFLTLSFFIKQCCCATKTPFQSLLIVLSASPHRLKKNVQISFLLYNPRIFLFLTHIMRGWNFESKLHYLLRKIILKLVQTIFRGYICYLPLNFQKQFPSFIKDASNIWVKEAIF